MKKLVLFCITVLTTFCLTGGDFIRNGKTSYSIVIPDQPDTGVKFAAQELQTFLKAFLAEPMRVEKTQNIRTGNDTLVYRLTSNRRTDQ